MSTGSGDSFLKVGVVILGVGVAAGYLLYTKYIKKALKFLEGSQVNKKAKIIDITNISHDTKRFRLDLGGPDVKLGLPTGKHVIFECNNPVFQRTDKNWNGVLDKEREREIVDRKYTPTTNDETTSGYVDFVIKIYKPGKLKMPDGRETTWTDGGKMSLHLDTLKVGDTIKMRGPTGLLEYYGKGCIKYPGSPAPHKKVKHIGMIAGGTGITPMLQILQASLADPSDTTTFSLIYGNKTQDDILVRDFLDRVSFDSRGRIKVQYTLDFPPQGWKFSQGFVSEGMIKEHLPKASEDDTLILMCGPTPMTQGCKSILLDLVHTKKNIGVF